MRPRHEKPAAALVLACLLAGCAKDLDAWCAELESPDPYVRRLAVNALASPDVFAQDPERSVEAILGAKLDWHRDVEAEAERAWDEVRPRAVPPLLAILCAEGEEWPARELVKLGAAALPALGAALRDAGCAHRDPVTRLLALQGAAALPALLAALDDADPATRELALQGLELLGPRAREALPELRRRHAESAGTERGRLERALRAVAGT